MFVFGKRLDDNEVKVFSYFLRNHASYDLVSECLLIYPFGYKSIIHVGKRNDPPVKWNIISRQT